MKRATAGPSARLPAQHGGTLGALGAASRNSLQSRLAMGKLGFVGGGFGGAVSWDGPILQQPPILHRATVDPHPHPRLDHLPPSVHPSRTCCRHRYARAQTPWYHWMSRGPLDKGTPPHPGQSPQQAPPWGVSDPRRVCVTHSHFFPKILTPLSPPSHPSPPPLPHLHLRRTPG